MDKQDLQPFRLAAVRSRPALTVGIITWYLIVRLAAETVALWLFDDPPGSPVAIDSSGNNHHLTLGPDAAVVAEGKFGGALDADATPQDGLGAFRYRAEKALNPGDEDWTLECWARAKPEMSGDNRIWGLSGVNYIDLGRGDAAGLFIASRFLPIDRVTGWNKPTGDLKADREYHHLAFVYDSGAGELRHYYDGKLKSTAKGRCKHVETGEPPYSDIVFPPHYPMLQIGMRDALQQWDHRELHAHDRHMKKFQGWDTGLQLMAVRQRLDGFVSADVDYRGGSITTPPVVFRGNRLQLNHACGAQGTIFVELRDLPDQPIPGYTLADCEEVTCDDVAWEVRWRGSGDLSSVAGRPVRMHLKMQSAKVYAFQFVSVTRSVE